MSIAPIIVVEGLREFLEAIRQHHLLRGHLRALFHVVIGRQIRRSDGAVLSAGVTWRELAELLRILRWDKELVRELGLDPDELPPRDRQRYWYQAIAAARVTAADARNLGDAYAVLVKKLGFDIGPAPGS